jgi:hypothetical protein
VGHLLATFFGLSETQALVVIFLILPFAVAAVVVPLVSWTWRGKPRPPLTSEILATGLPGEGRIVSVRPLGSILDMRPMVRFDLRISLDSDPDPFDLQVVQSIPRGLVHEFHPGDSVEVRVTADHQAGAVVLGGLGGHL